MMEPRRSVPPRFRLVPVTRYLWLVKIYKEEFNHGNTSGSVTGGKAAQRLQ